MAIELDFGIFDGVVIDFGMVFEFELNIDCGISYIFDFDVLLLDVIEGDIEV